jgi:hypothetical protein
LGDPQAEPGRGGLDWAASADVRECSASVFDAVVTGSA